MSAEALTPLPNDRAQHLLRALIQRHIRDGQPVGSRTLARDSGLDLSPATIRNVLSDLEGMGLVSAPHTSAGRVPTAKGYRLFVDTLVRYHPPRGGEIRKLQNQLGDKLLDADSLIGAVSNMLSDLTRMAGVVTVPRGKRSTLRQIEFLALSDNRILAILVLNDREVQNRIMHAAREYTSSELQQAANYINENYAGEDLNRIRERLVADLESTRESMNQAMLDIISASQTALAGASETDATYVITGETRLMDFAELSDIETLRRLFDAFSKKRLILDLLDRSIKATGVQVFIGDESGYGIPDECSVVATPYRLNNNTVGVIGVIGPTRMAYDRVVPLVDITSRLLVAALNQA